MEEEYFFQCPYCWEEISVLLDMSIVDEETIIEDCEVCCNPIAVSYAVRNDAAEYVEVERAQ